MKLLLAIDGSPCSDAAVSEICRRPWSEGTEVRIITVDAPWTEDLSRGRSSSAFDEINKQLRTEAWQRLNDAAAAFKRNAPDLFVTPVLREGYLKDKILDEAEDDDTDNRRSARFGEPLHYHRSLWNRVFVRAQIAPLFCAA